MDIKCDHKLTRENVELACDEPVATPVDMTVPCNLEVKDRKVIVIKRKTGNKPGLKKTGTTTLSPGRHSSGEIKQSILETMQHNANPSEKAPHPIPKPVKLKASFDTDLKSKLFRSMQLKYEQIVADYWEKEAKLNMRLNKLMTTQKPLVNRLGKPIPYTSITYTKEGKAMLRRMKEDVIDKAINRTDSQSTIDVKFHFKEQTSTTKDESKVPSSLYRKPSPVSEFPQVDYDDLLPRINEPQDTYNQHVFVSMNASRENLKPPRHTFKPGQERSLKYAIDVKTRKMKPRENYRKLQQQEMSKSQSSLCLLTGSSDAETKKTEMKESTVISELP